MLSKKDGIKIELENTNVSYHSYNDLNLIVTNPCSISQPELDSSYITVKGRNGLIDISEALTGRVSYKSRNISVEFAGIENAENWDNRISTLRNLIDGQAIRITFDNDKSYFWKGRCQLIDFVREGTCGRFTLSLPNADPFKYSVQTFNENWLWDPFSFETGVTQEEVIHEINNQNIQVTLPAGKMPVVPTVNVYSANDLKMQKLNSAGERTGRIYQLTVGEQELYSIMCNGPTATRLYFWGTGKFAVNFRGASL